MTTRSTPTDDGPAVGPGPLPPGGFDRVARVYHALERLAFGSTLERARFAHLTALTGCRDVLVLGDGDGRCVARVASMLPEARIRCVDGSAGMLARLQARLTPSDRARISCEQADIRTVALPARSYDAVLTMFVLDCLTDEEVARLAPRVAAALRPGGQWLFADFSIPARGWRRLRARLWVALLYAFFRWTAGLAVSSLPASEAHIREAGLTPGSTLTFQQGLIRSVLFEASPTVRPRADERRQRPPGC